ncbi:DNA-binding protein (plasmid) [Nostoc sp. CENA543]|uniref:helix-turn-helix domain-containing protein n=1 Tax=Nostoc sp. CENA543 TaxID=1869241 RepID=UPI000CA3D212|nr:helix-turn-helix transcriptional regulator [Nostoc sp. CENA543]AUT04641.1 DNA-binding protein [Nostoc sp. CENA543]
MPVRNTIKEFVDSKGITVYQFRKETGIAQATAYNLYNNPQQLPAPGVLAKICDRYECQPGELLRWDSKKAGIHETNKPN